MPSPAIVPVSVIIPFYNGNRFIERSVGSVQNQSVAPCEIIVVVDGSPEPLDETRLIATFKDSRVPVRFVYHDSNLGIPASRNTGVKYSIGSFVAFLDQDDEWLPHKIERQWALVEADGVHATSFVYYGRALRALKDGKWIAWPTTSLMRKLDGLPADTLKLLVLRGNPLPLITLLFSKQALEKVGGFNQDIKGGSDDYALLVAFAANGVRLRGVGGDGEVIARRHETGENYSDPIRFVNDDIRILGILADSYPEAGVLLRRGIAAAYYRAGRALLDFDVARGRLLLRTSLRKNPCAARTLAALISSYAPGPIRHSILNHVWNRVRRVRYGRYHLSDN